MEQKSKQIAELLKVLANEYRLLILCALINGPKIVSAISEYVPGITQSALSQHLALLKAHGILDSKKAGQNVTYFIADHRVNEVMNLLNNLYCRANSDSDRS